MTEEGNDGSVWGWGALAVGAPYRLKKLIGAVAYAAWEAGLSDNVREHMWDEGETAMQEIMRLTGNYEGESEVIG